MYWNVDLKRRDSRLFGFVRMGTLVTVMSDFPAWMSVSSV